LPIEVHMVNRTLLVTLLVTLVFAGSAAAQSNSGLSTLSPASRSMLIEGPATATERVMQPQRNRDSRWNGFLIGFVAGAIPGVLVGMGIRTYCENEARNCDGAVPVVGLIGGLAGGGIGAAIDGAIGNSLTQSRPRPGPGVRFSIRF
jgi:hypothetical protein